MIKVLREYTQSLETHLLLQHLIQTQVCTMELILLPSQETGLDSYTIVIEH